MAGSSMVSSFTGTLMSKRDLQRIVGDEHRARQLVRRDDVVMTEARHRAAAIDEDLQQRLFGDDPHIRARRRVPPTPRLPARRGGRSFGDWGTCLTRGQPP